MFMKKKTKNRFPIKRNSRRFFCLVRCLIVASFHHTTHTTYACLPFFFHVSVGCLHFNSIFVCYCSQFHFQKLRKSQAFRTYRIAAVNANILHCSCHAFKSEESHHKCTYEICGIDETSTKTRLIA